MAKWIQKARERMERKGTVGALHRSLGVPAGEKIPSGKLRTAAKSRNKKLAARARFALNVRK